MHDSAEKNVTIWLNCIQGKTNCLQVKQKETVTRQICLPVFSTGWWWYIGTLTPATETLLFYYGIRIVVLQCVLMLFPQCKKKNGCRTWMTEKGIKVGLYFFFTVGPGDFDSKDSMTQNWLQPHWSAIKAATWNQDVGPVPWRNCHQPEKVW